MKRLLIGLAALAFAGVAPAQEAPEGASTDLEGLWAARERFGPDVRGTLTIVRRGEEWRADLAGHSVAVAAEGDAVSFALPDGLGQFRGRREGDAILGQWVQQATYFSGSAFATPVTLRAAGGGQWRGEVIPLEDVFTFYMPVSRQADGTLAAWLRNTERNQGRFIPVSRIEAEGERVRLLGEDGGVIAEGRRDGDVLRIPLRNAGYDFERIDGQTNSAFYPRGRPSERYSYRPPVMLDDGWPVASVEEEGISRAEIEAFVQMLIDTPVDSPGSPQIHSVLIARNGRLVLEEYFHGHGREMRHDTRSAAKSWTATLIGAAMQAGVPIRLDTPVYETMLGGALPADLDPRKRAMTLEHLVTMTAGFHCDDGSDDAPGREDAMQEQTDEPDWRRFTMNVPMITAPGETLIYCSAEPDLAAGLLERVAGEPLPELFDRLVARPLQMGPYHLFLTPTGQAYGGGGHHFRPRDFLKLAQLMMDGGMWQGRRIVGAEWARQSTAPLRALSPVQRYGFLWNTAEYPWRGRTVQAFFAGGNGGQIFMAIPELDLAIGFTGGAYADPALFIPQRRYVPEFILPAVE
ncbi:MAG: beta-lactamase family protein [Sphingomonadaceae bacterium]|nr:beta-lactamase family protein [Sphingomonadaceae bacterium]